MKLVDRWWSTGAPVFGAFENWSFQSCGLGLPCRPSGVFTLRMDEWFRISGSAETVRGKCTDRG